MRKKFFSIMLCAFLTAMPVVQAGAEIVGYDAVLATYEKENNTPEVFQVDDGEGNAVNLVQQKEKLFIQADVTSVRDCPGEKGIVIGKLLKATPVKRVGVCENGWSMIQFLSGEEKVIGYISDQDLCQEVQQEIEKELLFAKKDSVVLDYPGMRDGNPVGEIHVEQKVIRTESLNEVWSKIIFRDDNGNKLQGYVETSVLDTGEEPFQADSGDMETTDHAADESADAQNVTGDDGAAQEQSGTGIFGSAGEDAYEETYEESYDTAYDVIDEDIDAGILHKGSGEESLFAKAVEEVPEVVSESGVQIGQPVAASSDSTLIPMGLFRITHYCPCSICCGPWTDGITSTGVTAITNHTIAVNPTQIPYGSQVVINGQVYVAEDCGGGIKDNCIDIYVATHEEGDQKGVYYTEVYLVKNE